ncbi:hypothetical protein J4476_02745 [Candidatus Woesearchaeota archaeon]|nr:MAG: hypothetical protein QT09_C0002G0009 [archaeon GW2011_AR18]MBS3161588.1 hypothetical protein [Candidatus Woesearchaeota archaeon]HIH26119.1 hypothetical protein [Nanoarchaeota archaeon]
MKKIMSIFVLCIFLVSVFSVYAEENTTTNSEKRIDKEQNKEVRKEAKENVKDARKDLKESRKGYKELKEEAKKCSKTTLKTKETPECSEKVREFKAEAKPFLKISSEEILKVLENEKKRVEASDLENKEEHIAALDELITKLKTIQDKISRMPEDSARTELKDIALLLRKNLQETRNSVKEVNGAFLGKRVGEIIKKAESMEKKMQKILDRLKTDGKDISSVQPDVDKFKANVASAKENHAKASVKIEEARTTKNKELKTEALKLLSDAHKNLKDANENLKDVVAKIRELNKSAKTKKEA